MIRLRLLAIGLLLALGSSPAYSQCSGQPASGRVCGNNAASTGLPGWQTMSSMLDRNFGGPSTQGTMLNRGASLWSATATPSLGLNGGTGGAITFNGATSGSVTLGVNTAAGSAVTFNLPTTNGSLNQVLITDGSGNTSWTTAGAGTVSSVGLALPASILTVSGSPVTGTGTLTGTLATQTANFVWAGPTTGAAATPTFRALVGADLPNPSGSTLGGVQSFAAVSSQWIRQISTSGVPTASQPAFSDISGTITAAQCVLPTVSTIGCVQAINAVASNWIRSISTSGVPALSQPAFTDISGNASLSQLPSISSNSVIGNNTGGTSIPSALSASQVLDMINNVQGDVIYRGASSWAALGPGTSGQVLTSGGAAANPSWTSVSGTGTVTSVATNNGITGGTFTSSGTIGLATITTGTVLANITGGSAIPIANTPSSILDLIGSGTGSILYRSSGSGWQALAAGTNGQVLTMGSTTPAWSSSGSVTNVTIAAGNGISVSGTCNISSSGTCTVGITNPIPPQGRLTLVANTPVMTTSNVSVATLRYDCYGGNQVPYYTGSVDDLDTISSCEVTDAMVSAASAGQVVGTQLYDVWWEGNTHHNICIAMSTGSGGGGGWSSDTGGSAISRGTGFTQLDYSTRPYVTNKNSISFCFNGATNYGSISANKLTYLGTIFSTSNGQTSWNLGAYGAPPTAGCLCVFNAYNRVDVATQIGETAASWTYGTATWREAHGDTTYSVAIVRGTAEESIVAVYDALGTAGSSSNIANSVGVNATTPFATSTIGYSSVNTFTILQSGKFSGAVGMGLYTIYPIEYNSNTTAGTWYGFSANLIQTGLSVSTRM